MTYRQEIIKWLKAKQKKRLKSKWKKGLPIDETFKKINFVLSELIALDIISKKKVDIKLFFNSDNESEYNAGLPKEYRKWLMIDDVEYRTLYYALKYEEEKELDERFNERNKVV